MVTFIKETNIMPKKQKRRSQEIPVDESKSTRFKRVVTPRVNKALKAIETVGYCTGLSYEYTPDQVKEILDSLNTAMASLGRKFSGQEAAGGGFAFKQ